MNDFWKNEFKIVEQFDRTIYLESYDNQELMLGVYFASYTPNKFRESELIGEDFQYRQYLTIALPKDRSNKDIVFKIISFFLHLARSKDHEMLIASPMHDDICYHA